jgi:hypothetical protein
MPLSLVHEISFLGSILQSLYKRIIKRELNKKLSSKVWFNYKVRLWISSKKK